MSRTCLRFKVKSPRQSPTSCRQSFRRRRNPPSKNGPQEISPLTISTGGRPYFSGVLLATGRTRERVFLRRQACSVKPSHLTPDLFYPIANWHAPTAPSTLLVK